MFKQGLKRLFTRLRNGRTHRLPDRRIVKQTLRMVRELAGQNSALTGSKQQPEPAKKKTATPAEQGAIEEQLDRLITGHPQRRGTVLVMACPGGNG